MKFINEISISVLFLLLIVLFLDPFMYLMSDSLVFMVLGALVVLFALFATFLWREKAHDEREAMHKMLAGRIGYLIGSGSLLIGFVVQVLSGGHVDPWLVFGLAGLVVGKLIALAYVKAKH
ncbi:hypothetical protein COU17_01250 [Candidatus Kaiserbacteria bacterium CG10_big_fil_rev_8_21_14_0_10_49_17]|uniref:Uncharacterized protein n=1 Tax=Candidatus Kaiserbacteria bacterium CG10_big_fil_rev_8_21_14_0_10_49_17 TaxID=1974609 RepID=A0A2M6WEN1_9BACT|nr:MAG: hypothetical protein COU17_01250 [Candidatus Kaiserbacteria bacterium CG10_big_fil_rev_8_21_14_0_10_49_17]